MVNTAILSHGIEFSYVHSKSDEMTRWFTTGFFYILPDGAQFIHFPVIVYAKKMKGLVFSSPFVNRFIAD